MPRCIQMRDRDGRGGLVLNQQPDVGQPKARSSRPPRDGTGHAAGPTTAARRQPRQCMPTQHRLPSGGRNPRSESDRSPLSREMRPCRDDQQRIDDERTCQGQEQRHEHPLRLRRQPRRGRHDSPCCFGLSVLGVGSICLAVRGTARHRMIVPGKPLRRSVASPSLRAPQDWDSPSRR